MEYQRITEENSLYRHLETWKVEDMLAAMNREDKTVPQAIEQVLPSISAFVQATSDRMLAGGRLFYVGAGTSGRLGILDASECPPTYGVPPTLIIGIIAGGPKAIQQAVENAEDNEGQAWKDMAKFSPGKQDTILGIAASGSTPYVIGALKKAKENGMLTGSLSCNPGSPVSSYAEFPIECVVGPEFITGSTRMKSGTAQKLILNMISTSLMILLGRVEDNKMVNMQLTNKKLIDRGVKMIMEQTGLKEYELAKDALLKYGSVKNAMQSLSVDI
ncbi:N-acetylmuramic acid 6-phosphate etherase [Flavihumibacter sp. UBA7668]|uniref:N-acetylmuramic acid 6-phosphate etherase n=1 Tax=Flavihumibacter sp. UBA7668 TaxID=1946542 RepID=UPI0025C23AEB|nr:N-acetylmuramic acid 6-phosphate etherase [Flavihumibacter sp. UBA7668]